MRSTVCVGLGANLGDARATLAAAVASLHAVADSAVLRVSSLYRSAPVQAQGPDFFNAVAELETGLSPQELLTALQAIEHAAGRERPYRNAPRTLDLDILLWNDERIDTPALSVPHPRLYERAFVLQPLAELYPGRIMPAQLQAVHDQPVELVAASFFSNL